MTKNKIAAGLAVVVLLTVGVLVAATQALPGGLLYGVKLGVLERVEGVFAGNSSEAKANRHIKLAERRLAEADEAAAKERFDADAQTAVLVEFNTHMKGVEEYIAELNAEGNVEAIKTIAVKTGQMLAQKAQLLASTQAQIKTSLNLQAQDSLDFLMLRVGDTLAAAASIAASTRIEDPAPEGENAPVPTDDWGRPIEQ